MIKIIIFFTFRNAEDVEALMLLRKKYFVCPHIFLHASVSRSVGRNGKYAGMVMIQKKSMYLYFR